MNLCQRKETAVSIEEIVHTCSNENVAQAAVASLGLVFAARVQSEAEHHGVTPGAYVARLVYEFGKAADAGARRAVRHAMERADQPLLAGLRLILESRLRAAGDDADAEWSIGQLAFPNPPAVALRHAE
jgi:hypothetical protein